MLSSIISQIGNHRSMNHRSVILISVYRERAGHTYRDCACIQCCPIRWIERDVSASQDLSKFNAVIFDGNGDVLVNLCPRDGVQCSVHDSKRVSKMLRGAWVLYSQSVLVLCDVQLPALSRHSLCFGRASLSLSLTAFLSSDARSPPC